MKGAVLIAAGMLAVAGISFAWQSVGASGPALPLRTVGDFPLTGNATRFDYASIDDARGTLWVAHMGDGSIEAFDTKTNRVSLTVPLGPDASVRGLLVARGNVYAAAQGLGSVVALDARGRRIGAAPVDDPDGLAYDPGTQRVFVSDESGGCSSSHSVAIDAGERAAYVGCQHNMRLVRLDLRTGRVVASGAVGVGVDVLALDAARHRLYVASESGVVSVYDVGGGRLRRAAQAFVALNAHVVAVDPVTHRVYFPLRDIGGRPVMRVMEPT